MFGGVGFLGHSEGKMEKRVGNVSMGRKLPSLNPSPRSVWKGGFTRLQGNLCPARAGRMLGICFPKPHQRTVIGYHQ